MNRHLPSFHRYLSLRKRMMGLNELHYYDLYAPLVGSVDLKYTPEEAQQHILAAMGPLGPEYVNVLKRAFADRWIDLFPSPANGPAPTRTAAPTTCTPTCCSTTTASTTT